MCLMLDVTPLPTPPLPAYPAAAALLSLNEAWNVGLLALALQVTARTHAHTPKTGWTNVAKARLEQNPLPSKTAGGWALRFILCSRARGPVLDNSSCLEPSGSNSRLLALFPCSWPTTISDSLPTETHHLTASFRAYSDSAADSGQRGSSPRGGCRGWEQEEEEEERRGFGGYTGCGPLLSAVARAGERESEHEVAAGLPSLPPSSSPESESRPSFCRPCSTSCRPNQRPAERRSSV